jgi:hypothetical protein
MKGKCCKVCGERTGKKNKTGFCRSCSMRRINKERLKNAKKNK